MPPKGFQPRNPSASKNSLAPYVRTMPAVVDAMLELADLSADDVIYDLGCGDGRIILRAAELYGTNGLGVDLDDDCLKVARQRAKEMGVGDRVRFRRQDLLKLNCSAATVVALYLLPKSNLALRDKLRAELTPGSRIISHSFDMGDWQPDATSTASDAINTYSIYLWRV